MAKKAYFFGIAQLTPNSEITILDGLEYKDSIDCHKIQDELGRLHIGNTSPVSVAGKVVSARKIVSEKYTVELPIEIDSTNRRTTFIVRKSGS